MQQNCKTCCHWDTVDWSSSSARGDCRRYAPHPYIEGIEALLILHARMLGKDVVGDEASLEINKTKWPNTGALDWCSEWQSTDVNPII